MDDRTDLLEKKRRELLSVIEEASNLFKEKTASPEDILESLLGNGLTLEPPQEKRFIALISLGNNGNYYSIKPGNIILNMRKLINNMPDLVSEAAELAGGSPVLKVCTALRIWKMLKDISTVKVTEEQAVALIALWKNCSQSKRITLEDGFNYFSSLYNGYAKTECTWDQYMKVIDDLEKLGSIQLDDNGILLIEYARKPYIR